MTTPVSGVFTLGTTTTVTTTLPGQTGQFTLAGVAGQVLRLTVSNVSSSTSGTYVGVYVYAPNYSYVGGTGTNAGGPSASIDLPALPSTGTYTISISGVPAWSTFSTQVLFALSSGGGGSSGGALPTNGTPTDVALSTPGGTVDLTFDAATGEEVGIQLSQLTLNGGTNDSLQYSLVPPVGSPYSPLTCYENSSGCNVQYMSLAYTGTYKLSLTAQSGLTGSVKAQAWKYVALTGTMVTGSPATVTTSVNGQTARYTYGGNSGQLLRLSLSNASSSTGASYISVYIYAPNWTYVGGTSVAPGGTASVDLPALPSTGSYKVNFSAGPPGKFSVQALLAPR
jgi:hypothetical protein